MNKILVNTFTSIYDEIEDRIILVINYEEIHNRVDFMITRSFILKLLPTADEFLMQHYWGKEVQSDTINLSSPAIDDKKSTLQQTNNVNLELFSKEKELLQEVNFAYIEDKKLTTFSLSSTKTLAVASLEYIMLKQLFDTIKASIPNFAWGISVHF